MKEAQFTVVHIDVLVAETRYTTVNCVSFIDV